MNNQPNQQRIKIIYQMLFEMSTGNLAFRIPLEESDNPLEELAALLNTVAEKMQSVISQHGYINLSNAFKKRYDYSPSELKREYYCTRANETAR